ncbi:hypothetical protein L210DRAFT_3657838 [Boletus edulis BED1]|uniref:Uncharacterized protein n=1 Tax=Boletus edulis BED1 TaxID=1328754 RepID=A0AAD4BAZ7_BOLED|nr:hypothetical protein L210DRAFT_3657838 [Boletus edulis BED1]
MDVDVEAEGAWGWKRDTPLVQRPPTACARPSAVHPSAIASDNNEDKPRLFLVLYPGVQSRHALERTKVRGSERKGDYPYCRGRGKAPANGDGEGLKKEGDVGEDKERTSGGEASRDNQHDPSLGGGWRRGPELTSTTSRWVEDGDEGRLTIIDQTSCITLMSHRAPSL